MPIHPNNRDRYPKNWRQIRERILERARNRCEECGAFNRSSGYRGPTGKWYDHGNTGMDWKQLPDGRGVRTDSRGRELRYTRRIVLTVAHLDHTPENCTDDNLRALCQYCHLKHDREHHLQQRYHRRRRGLAVRDLFEATS